MNNHAPANLLKLVRKLHLKKYRDRYGLFIVERLKTIKPYLSNGWQPEYIFVSDEAQYEIFKNYPVFYVNEREMKKISLFKTPQKVLAVFKMRNFEPLEPKGLIPLLDYVQDPGNLGTLARTADWFGITRMVCSPGSADIYNPKTIQAAMGALARIKVYYADLKQLIKNSRIPVYVADMDGVNLFKTKLPENLFIILGNEGHGVSSELKNMANYRITIPSAPDKISESLNLAMSGGIIFSHWFYLQGFAT